MANEVDGDGIYEDNITEIIDCTKEIAPMMENDLIYSTFYCDFIIGVDTLEDLFLDCRASPGTRKAFLSNDTQDNLVPVHVHAPILMQASIRRGTCRQSQFRLDQCRRRR